MRRRKSKGTRNAYTPPPFLRKCSKPPENIICNVLNAIFRERSFISVYFLSIFLLHSFFKNVWPIFWMTIFLYFFYLFDFFFRYSGTTAHLYILLMNTKIGIEFYFHPIKIWTLIRQTRPRYKSYPKMNKPVHPCPLTRGILIFPQTTGSQEIFQCHKSRNRSV